MPPSRGDIEMTAIRVKEDSEGERGQGSSDRSDGNGGGGKGSGRAGSGAGSGYQRSAMTMREPIYDEPPPQSFVDRFVDSFKRDTTRRGGFGFIGGIDDVSKLDSFFGMPSPPSHGRQSAMHWPGTVHGLHGSGGGGGGIFTGGEPPDDDPSDHHGLLSGHYYDLHMANLQTAHSGLARKLKGRHLQMIAIGGSIGTGLFVASGRALSTGGPAAVLLAFTLVGIMLYCTMQALGELAVVFPVAGSFANYSTRFLDPSWGFAMGWNYALQWLVVLPLEIIAASLTIDFWTKNLPAGTGPARAIFVTVFLIVIVAINMFGVKGYGEAEFIFAIVKVIAVIGFILLGIVLNCGGTPGHGYIGGMYWRNPGAFNNGFKGLCSCFVTAAFAFAGTELVGLAAAETANPRKSLPTAIKQVFWRITLFYIVALTLVGLLVPYDEKRLLNPANKADAAASPFVIAIENAGIDVLPSVMNSVILVAVLSVGNSAVFGSSRTLAALADQSLAPKILSYVDRKGRPLVAIMVAGAFGFLAYLADLQDPSSVLDWLLAASGLSSIFTWGSICLAHIRFRKAWQENGRSLDQLAFRAALGVRGSYVGFVFNVLVLVAQFWVGAWPVGFEKKTSGQLARNFFLDYMAAPIVLIFYFSHKLYYRTRPLRVKDMDIDTGRRDFNLPILIAHEKQERRSWPKWKVVYKFFC